MLEFIKNLFADKYSSGINVKKNADNITDPQKVLNKEFGKDPDTQVSLLLKKATSLKKIDIEQSILLIKEVLKIYPNYPCYDKLMNYLVLANKIDEAEKLMAKLIDESSDNNPLYNINKRSSYYEIYADFLFKKESYREYIFYYCLSIYNRMVWNTVTEDITSVNSELKYLKNKEIFTDNKTNKSFQEIGASLNQDLFIKTLYAVLKNFQFNALNKLVRYLINNQIYKDKLEIERIKNEKEDWLLWSNKEFREIILNYNEQIFIEKYKTNLEILLEKSS